VCAVQLQGTQFARGFYCAVGNSSWTQAVAVGWQITERFALATASDWLWCIWQLRRTVGLRPC